LTETTVRDDVARKAKRQEQDLEKWKERGVMLRVFVYVFASHLFAGFVWLLFYVGEHAQK
jgi:uracil DNA glycosylase